VSSEGDRPEYEGVSGQHVTENRPLTSVRTRQEHIATIAKRHTDSPLTTLNHHLDMLWMYEAFSRVRKDCASGIDGITAEQYAHNLDANLADLLERIKSGRYRASPTRRVYIPKNETEFRPISIPILEDKIAQRAVVMLLEPICEKDFMDCSYGFRPNRSPHKALDALRTCLKEMNGGWVVDVDIRKYFDSIPHAQLKELLRLRVNDSVINRLIAKWLRAGTIDNGTFIKSDEEGTPQGGVVSPIISNIYLHYVLDQWFENAVKPALKGKAHMIRFADDFVAVFERLDDAQRFMNVLPKRFAKYELEIHPDKTKLVDFRHPWDSGQKPETFDFLGFTHYWGKTKKGGYGLKKKTSAKKMRIALKKIHEWCKENRHKPMAWQHRQLCAKLQGHYAYYGITPNSDAIAAFRHQVLRIWRYWLNRRSRKRDGLDWKRFQSILKNTYRVPYAHLVHKLEKEVQLCLGI
jgi:RNA-directed DNA polymerase